MRIFKYWHKEAAKAQDASGYTYELVAWANSNESPDAARVEAKSKLREWTEKLLQGGKLDRYDYGRRDIREELIDVIENPGGEPVAATTRNRYGALVLNTRSTLIADIDAEKKPFFHRLYALIGRVTKDKDFHRARIAEFAVTNAALKLAVYETHSGFRVFVLNRDIDPSSEEAQQILNALGSDRLYQRLCLAQECYRARLTPKPWRSGCSRPPNDFPRTEGPAQSAFDEWLADYKHRSSGYAVCRLEAEYGQDRPTADAEKIRRAHDAAVLAHSSVRLA